jgi:hypothetical protein
MEAPLFTAGEDVTTITSVEQITALRFTPCSGLYGCRLCGD